MFKAQRNSFQKELQMKNKNMMFELNDKVVYPGHGVAFVASLDEKHVSGATITFYKLNFLYKDMTILVPIHSLPTIGVRYLSDPKIIKKTLKELDANPKKRFEELDLSPSGWNKRSKDYNMKMQSGALKDIISIYCDLMHIRLKKELSFGEKSLLQSTEDLIVQEIIEVLGKDRTDALQRLRDPFKRLMITSVSKQNAQSSIEQ